jgi:hypothetical protein
MGNRERKARIGQLLGRGDVESAMQAVLQMPGRQAVNPLIAYLYSGDERMRWLAITVLGRVVGKMAQRDMEPARVVMRRLMWNLNDESGGIGWGSAEAMGEITAVHAGLADEFGAILISYINPGGNFLEHELLQRGSLWGVGRLAHARPRLAEPAAAYLPAFFDSPDPYLRGTAIWAAGPLLDDDMRILVKATVSDNAPLRLYRRMQIARTTVGKLARAALAGTDL